MFGRLMPKEGKYFDLFNAHAELIVQGGKALSGLISALVDAPDQAVKHADAIDDLERQADKITHETHRAAAHLLHHAARPRRNPSADQHAWTTSWT